MRLYILIIGYQSFLTSISTKITNILMMVFDTVQLDLNFTNTRVCNSTRTTRVQKSLLRAHVHTTGW